MSAVNLNFSAKDVPESIIYCYQPIMADGNVECEHAIINYLGTLSWQNGKCYTYLLRP